MKQEKINITEAQFRKLIREEGEKIKKEFILRAQLEKIDQELLKLNEVHAGGNMAPGADGVHAGQKKPVFTKKGTHLVEDDLDDEIGSEEMESPEMGGEEMESPEMGGEEMEMGDEPLNNEEIMAAIQDLGNSLNLKGVVEFTGKDDVDGSIESPEDDNVEIDVDIENGTDDSQEAETEEMSTEEPESDETGTEEEIDECGDEMEEGSTEMISENDKAKGPILTEEMKRMKFLAGIK